MTHGRVVLQIVGLLILTGAVVYYQRAVQVGSHLVRPPQIVEKEQTQQTHVGLTTDSASSRGEGKLVAGELERAWPGFTLYPVSGTATVLLLNLSGRVVHTWSLDADRARLLPNGNLLVLHGSKWGLSQPHWRALRQVIREYDWNGNVVWEKRVEEPAHHDIQRLSNGHTLFLQRAYVPKSVRATFSDKARAQQRIRSDRIVELDGKGVEIWDWFAHEHINPETCGKRPCKLLSESLGAGGHAVDWTHMNTLSVLPENRWFAQGDTRFRPGNILTSARNHSTVYLIDKDSKNVVWQYSGSYKGGLSGGHEPTMIGPDLPGAGNILIFDNGRDDHPEESFILEVNPVTNEVVWVYDPERSFHSKIAGSQQRLPNGNTLISEDDNGNLFEVTREGSTVWEYQGRYRTSRAQRYPPDYTNYFKELPLYE
jgi:Arylsulfotransferase (ASST)